MKDPDEGRSSVVLRMTKEGETELVREPLAEMPAELKQIIEQMG